MAWPPDYVRDGTEWFNPFPTKYLTPAAKWMPPYYPPEWWQVIASPPEFDENGNRVAPQPPPGLPVYWWLQPKETWHYLYEMPWEAKQLGAWPASQVLMPEDLHNIWPGKQRSHPPFGFLKLKMDGELDGTYGKGRQIFAMDMHVHMRWISPDEMRVKTALTPFGPRYYFQSRGWEQHESDYKEFRRAYNARRRRISKEQQALRKAKHDDEVAIELQKLREAKAQQEISGDKPRPSLF